MTDELTINPNLFVPIEFTDTDGSKHTGRSWTLLIQSVAAYRQRNNRPVGDIEREIVRQVCQRWPHRCSQRGRTLTSEESTDLHMRILEWTLRQKGVPLIPSEVEVRARAEICSQCPRQRGWARNCGSCAGKVAKLRVEKLGKQRADASFSQNLLGCATLGEDTRISVWLNATPVDSDRLPKNCWRRKP